MNANHIQTSTANPEAHDPPTTDRLTGVVLAGGRGQRMGGYDKGLMALNGRPLISYVVAALRPQVSRLIISANRHVARYERLGFRVVSDRSPSYAGPLAGVASALAVVETEYVVTAPCDSPWLAPDLASRLGRTLAAERGQVAAARCQGRLHPTFALIPGNLRDDLDEALARGQRKAEAWLRDHDLAIADFDDQPGAFINVNTPDELARAEMYLRTGQPPPETL